MRNAALDGLDIYLSKHMCPIREIETVGLLGCIQGLLFFILYMNEMHSKWLFKFYFIC